MERIFSFFLESAFLGPFLFGRKKAFTLGTLGCSECLFWSRAEEVQSATSNWGQRHIAPVFKAAGITSDGHIISHRLRDTFAVDLPTARDVAH